jgi:hypothetical protein
VVEGEIEVANNRLKKRDAIGVSEIESIDIKVINNSELVIIEVPMN